MLEIKSKRAPASRQYKIAKKVKEHGRKQRKEAKLNPHKKKLKKDPGIPSLFPFKEKLLQQIEATKMQKIADKQAKKVSDSAALAKLLQSADQRAKIFENESVKTEQYAIQSEMAAVGRKDNSKRAYYKEFVKVIEEADVILEVLDARDPIGTRPKSVEESIINAGINKRIILILNKIDLVPREVVEKWLKYLRNEFPTVAFKASTQSQRNNLSQSSISTSMASDDLLNSSECLGADNLVSLLKNYCRNSKIKTSITVGVIGFPNVGKSSVINSLKRSRACNVGASPGITKVAQHIQLDKNIKLLDCPGIVFGKVSTLDPKAQAEALLRNCVKTELIEDPIAPVEVILDRCSHSQLEELYDIPPFMDTKDFLILLAKQRGKLRKGGIPDLENTARSVLQDWNAGRVPFYTIPPVVEKEVIAANSSIVTGWAREFQISDIVSVEKDGVLSNIASGDSMGKVLALKDNGSTEVDELAYVQDEDEMNHDEDFSDVSDDGESMEESEIEDPMEEEEVKPVAPIPSRKAISSTIALNTAKLMAKASAKKAKLNAIDKSEEFSPAERMLNPQTNKDKKKALKQRKKTERKMMRDDDEEYDFSEHFGLPEVDMED